MYTGHQAAIEKLGPEKGQKGLNVESGDYEMRCHRTLGSHGDGDTPTWAYPWPRVDRLEPVIGALVGSPVVFCLLCSRPLLFPAADGRPICITRSQNDPYARLLLAIQFPVVERRSGPGRLMCGFKVYQNLGELSPHV
jgi:hypothetical protein